MGTKSIDTLVEDIYSLLDGSDKEISRDLAEDYGKKFGQMLYDRVSRQERDPYLRMSNVGKPCERQLWYEINTPEDGEKLSGSTRIKFLMGDAVELLLLFLAEASGHTVEGTQDTQEIEGIKGHRDAVIDGVVVDAKSASTYSFKKFAEGTLAENDSFGYIDQLQSYLYAGQTDDTVTDKSRGAFLVMDKVLGHICLDIHPYKGLPYDKIYAHKKAMVASPEPPERAFSPEPDGASGNQKLGVNCSYCSFKAKCHPGLRTFIYSNGPRFLTTVKKEPNVPEAKDE